MGRRGGRWPIMGAVGGVEDDTVGWALTAAGEMQLAWWRWRFHGPDEAAGGVGGDAAGACMAPWQGWAVLQRKEAAGLVEGLWA